MRISVAMATFNGAEYVEEQLASILGGTLVPDQVVVSDDNSTDDTVARVRAGFDAHGEDRTRLLVLDGHRQVGIAANFERAIAACDGELIVLSDQDDLWHRDRLSAALPAFEADSALLLQHADARLVNAIGEALGDTLLGALSIRRSERAAIASGHAFRAYIRRNLATGATIVLRRDLVALARPFPKEWVHDEWLAIIAAATGRVGLLDRQLVDYRQHGGNQIGAVAPTMRYRVSRFLEPRRDRYVVLARRAAILADRLDALNAPREIRQLARQKQRFELVRSTFPRSRIRRLPLILKEAVRGSYRRLSSQGSIDVLRDLFQPP